MNPVSIAHRILLLVLMIATGLAFSACESDPILAPQSEVAEESGGSYGNTNLPVSGTHNSQSGVKNQQNAKTVENRAPITNPKLF